MKFNKRILISAAAVVLSLGGSGVITSSFTNATPVQAAMNSKQQAVVNLAKQQVGKPYVWGAAGPNSFDCSGLVQYVYSHAAGINLPRVTTQQETCGSEVSLNALEAGDLLFWGNRGNTYHVAIYIGDGNFVQAPEPGQNVKVTNMKYYYPNFARRVMSTQPDLFRHGILDNLSYSNNNINVAGWYIGDDTSNKPYTYLFALDADTNKELARWSVARSQRPDVHNAWPNVINSLNSGFSGSFKVPENIKGHTIKIMVRYTASPTGDDAHGSDFKYDKTLYLGPAEKHYAIDNLTQTGNVLNAAGWNVASYTEDKPNRYLLVMDADSHVEYARVKVNAVSRPDVNKLYSRFPNAMNSGFNNQVPITNNMHGRNVFLIMRYSDSPNGDGNFVDTWANDKVIHIN